AASGGVAVVRGRQSVIRAVDGAGRGTTPNASPSELAAVPGIPGAADTCCVRADMGAVSQDFANAAGASPFATSRTPIQRSARLGADRGNNTLGSSFACRTAAAGTEPAAIFRCTLPAARARCTELVSQSWTRHDGAATGHFSDPVAFCGRNRPHDRAGGHLGRLAPPGKADPLTSGVHPWK